MAGRHPYLHAMLDRLRQLRTGSGVSPQQLEEKLILGPGWVNRFEQGTSVPSIDLVLAILHAMGKSPEDLVNGLPYAPAAHIFERCLFAEQEGANLKIHFVYADFDATYVLPNATLAQFDDVLKTLRNELAKLASPEPGAGEAIKTDAVAKSFLRATTLWPHANPSDLWWFVIYRAYCDPFNHPARFARLDFTQSWKRTGGWALEEVLVRHYGPHLLKQGIRLFIASSDVKERLLKSVLADDRLEPDKADVLITGLDGNKEVFLGVVHVKASFAERRTDDVPMSRALINAGYVSPLWTMDCKGSPSATPNNRGELGTALVAGDDQRSAKRKDIEDDGYFSACFSYNQNTVPTPTSQKVKAGVVVCNFNNVDDAFSRFLIQEWKRRRK